VLARADESGPVSTEQEQSQNIETPAYDVPEAASEEQENQNQTNQS